MCGIAGMIPMIKSIDHVDRVQKMVAALSHRGPDDQQVLHCHSVVLGHARLSIQDVSEKGRQPMVHQSGNWIIVYNGEIYNHMELRNRLPPYPYKGDSDTETLLHALEVWGIDVVKSLNGMFAFAAFDVRNNRLLLVRDRFGVKPLYIAKGQDGLFFASEMKSILAAGFPRVPRLDVLRRKLTHIWVNGKDTPITDIERVMPGTILHIDLNNLQTHEEIWYEPANSIDVGLAEELSGMKRSEIVKKIEEALYKSVLCRLDAHVPIGVLCSGGLDSSLVSAIAAKEAVPLIAFNASIPDQPELDETHWAELVCQKAKLPLSTVPMTKDGWRRHFVRSVMHFEYPLVHESSIALAMITKQANKEGIRVLLTGEAADELFGGYGSRHQRERSRFQGTIFEEQANTKKSLLSFLDHGNLPSMRDYERKAFESSFHAYAHHDGDRRALEAAIASDLRIFLPHGLNRKDKNTMQHAVEIREPFLDLDIVKLALNLPLEMRIYPKLKGVLLDVASSYLPIEVINRPKIGFSFDPSIYFADEMRSEALESGYLCDLLEVTSEDWKQVVRSATGRTLFRLWSTEMWCRLFLEGCTVEQVEETVWKN